MVSPLGSGDRMTAKSQVEDVYIEANTCKAVNHKHQVYRKSSKSQNPHGSFLSILRVTTNLSFKLTYFWKWKVVTVITVLGWQWWTWAVWEQQGCVVTLLTYQATPGSLGAPSLPSLSVTGPYKIIVTALCALLIVSSAVWAWLESIFVSLQAWDTKCVK